jgi:uncharacterized protein (TIGR03067 family)
MKPFALSVLVVALLFSKTTLAQDAKQELEKLQGTWTFVSYEESGFKFDQSSVTSLVIRGDTFQFKATGDFAPQGTLALDPAKQPKHLDLIVKEDDGDQATWPGIYELAGDTLKLCIDDGKQEHPKEFKTTMVKFKLFVFKRG